MPREPLVGRRERREPGAIPPRLDVAPRIQQGHVAGHRHAGAVAVSRDDEVGRPRAPEQLEAGLPAVAAVGEGDPDTLVLDGSGFGQALSEGPGVGVAVDGDQSLGLLAEGGVDPLGREVAGVDHEVGIAGGLESRSLETVAVGRVGVGVDREHGRSTARGVTGVTTGSVPADEPPTFLTVRPKRGSMASSTSVVLAALFANGAIAILKFGGFLLTGSPAMLSETYHSISDTGNQVFLLIGIKYGAQDANRTHPFGHGKAQFFYSFLVSVILFGIAGWESARHGYEALQEGGVHRAAGDVTLLGATFDPVYVNYVVLIGAIVFETYALKKANDGLSRQMDEHGWETYREAFRKTSDVTTLTAFTEDSIALAGAGIALAGVYLTRVTGNGLYDAAAALLIGFLLMGFAIALAWENKRLLLGESLPAPAESELRDIIADGDGVREIVDFRTVYFGPEELLVVADVRFDPGLDTGEIDDRITEIEAALTAHSSQVQRVYVEPE